jgi:spore maturation protein CgeB
MGLRLRFANPDALAPGEDIEIIQHSRINLQLGSAADDGGSPSWGLPERCFGIPACGGFLLSDERLHAGDDFDSQTEWASFADDAEALGQIRRSLADLPAARRIADAAHRHAMASHTYLRRAARLLEFGEALRPRAQLAAGDVG